MELIDADMPTWAPDTRHYVTTDGRHVAVHVDAGLNDLTAALLDESLAASVLPTLPSGVHKIVVEPTTIFACAEDGTAIDLTPLATFPPGTSHEDAVSQLEQE